MRQPDEDDEAFWMGLIVLTVLLAIFFVFLVFLGA